MGRPAIRHRKLERMLLLRGVKGAILPGEMVVCLDYRQNRRLSVKVQNGTMEGWPVRWPFALRIRLTWSRWEGLGTEFF